MEVSILAPLPEVSKQPSLQPQLSTAPTTLPSPCHHHSHHHLHHQVGCPPLKAGAKIGPFLGCFFSVFGCSREKSNLQQVTVSYNTDTQISWRGAKTSKQPLPKRPLDTGAAYATQTPPCWRTCLFQSVHFLLSSQ